MAAEEEETKMAGDLAEMLENNKLDNSELLAALQAEGVTSMDDLTNHFQSNADVEAIVKSVRKRTEKMLQALSSKIVDMTGVDYEYKAPRRRAKESNASPSSPGDPYLSPAESPRGGGGKKKKRKSKGQPTKTAKELRTESSAQSATLMRQWLQRRGIFHKDLFNYLASHGYNQPDDLVDLPEKKFDYIVREVRVETFKDVNQASKRNRVDKLLTKFEKEWRKYSGIRKTNMTKEQQEMWGYSPVSSRGNSEAEDDEAFTY